jgi:hypothetical protein
MRILLDECVPWSMHRFLGGYECVTVKQQGWMGIKNGDLLRLAESEFDLFITSDQNILYQQNLTDHRLSILELSSNSIRRISAAAALIRSTIVDMKPGELRRLEIP